MNNNEYVFKNNSLQLASTSSRIKAFVIDDLLVTLVYFFIYWENFAQAQTVENMIVVANETIYQAFILKFSYQAFFIWYYGATIGKIVAKIKVIDYNHFGKVTLVSSLIRSFFRLLSEMFFYIGFFLAFFNEGKQTLQDKVAKTLVVHA